MTNLDNFLTKISSIVKHEGITLDELAQKLSISRASMYNYRKGKSNPPKKLVDRVNSMYSIISDSTSKTDLEYTAPKRIQREHVVKDLETALSYLTSGNIDKVNILGVISILRKSADLLEKIEESDELL